MRFCMHQGSLSLLLALGAVGFFLISGVSASSSVMVTLVLMIQTWGGWAIWRSIRRDGSPIENLGMAIAIGTALSALAGVAVRAVFETTVGWILPAVIGLILVLRQRRSSAPESQAARPDDLGVRFATLLGLGTGVAAVLLVSIRSYPLSWQGSWTSYHGDMLFFEALGSSLAEVGPLDSIFSPDMVVRYHWLVYGWTGFLTDASNAEPFVALTRVVPLVTLVAAVMIAAAWTRRLTHTPWAPLLAVALIVTGGYVGASYGTILNFDSPSMSLTAVWLMAAVFLAWLQIEAPGDRPAPVMLLALMAAAITAGKVSSGAVLVIALLSAAAMGLLHRSTWRWHATQLALIAGASSLLTYLVVMAGSADPGGLGLLSWVDRASSVQGLNPAPGLAGVVLGTVILAAAVLARWVGGLWFFREPATRWSSIAAIALGLALGGIVPLLLVSGGVNETWFALAASAPLSVISAAGLGRFAEWLTTSASQPVKRFLIVAVVGAILLWAVVAALWTSGPSGGNIWEYTLRWAGPLTAFVGALLIGYFVARPLRLPGAGLGFTLLIIVLIAVPGRLLALAPTPAGSQPGTRGELFGTQTSFSQGRDQTFVIGWSDLEVAAGTWLRQQAGDGALIATNHTFSPLVPALSSKQTLVSGMHYQAPYGWPGNQRVLNLRESQSWDFIDSPSSESWQPLCQAGVTHLWIDPRRTSATSWMPWAKPVVESTEALVLVVTSEASRSCS